MGHKEVSGVIVPYLHITDRTSSIHKPFGLGMGFGVLMGVVLAYATVYFPDFRILYLLVPWVAVYAWEMREGKMRDLVGSALLLFMSALPFSLIAPQMVWHSGLSQEGNLFLFYGVPLLVLLSYAIRQILRKHPRPSREDEILVGGDLNPLLALPVGWVLGCFYTTTPYFWVFAVLLEGSILSLPHLTYNRRKFGFGWAVILLMCGWIVSALLLNLPYTFPFDQGAVRKNFLVASTFISVCYLLIREGNREYKIAYFKHITRSS